MQIIHLAAQSGEIKKIKKILEKDGVEIINSPDKDGYTALHWAVQEGFFKIVEFLISMGADINIVDKEGFHVLEIACTKGHKDIVELLLMKGADVNQSRRGFTALHAAAASCHSAIVKLLIDNEVEIDIKDNDGKSRTPLHWATQEGCLEIVKLLLDNGSDVNCLEDGDGFTPLAIAVSEGHIEIVKTLLQKGSDVNIRCPSDSNTTPLHTACAWNQADIAEVLIINGADTLAKDADGQTPLDIAIDLKNASVVKILENGVGS